MRAVVGHNREGLRRPITNVVEESSSLLSIPPSRSWLSFQSTFKKDVDAKTRIRQRSSSGTKSRTPWILFSTTKAEGSPSQAPRVDCHRSSWYGGTESKLRVIMDYAESTSSLKSSYPLLKQHDILLAVGGFPYLQAWTLRSFYHGAFLGEIAEGHACVRL